MKKYQTYHTGEVQVYGSRKSWETLRIRWSQRLQTEFTQHTKGKIKKNGMTRIVLAAKAR